MSNLLTSPREKISSIPILASDCAREVRRAGASVWLAQKSDFGFVLRCELGSKQFRLVLQPLTPSNEEIPPESLTPTCVVHDLPSLRIWLQSLSA